MNGQAKPVATALTYAGALPFVACAALALAGKSLFGLNPVAVARVYSLAIAAFMAGTIWGYAVPSTRGERGAVLLALSNVLTLVVVFAALAPAPRVTLGLDAAAFLALLAVDAWAHRLGWLSADYLALRTRVSALVVVALAVTWAAA